MKSIMIIENILLKLSTVSNLLALYFILKRITEDFKKILNKETIKNTFLRK